MSSNIRIVRICQYCGKEFVARTTVTKTCSDRCAKRAYKLRIKQEKIQKSNQETVKTVKNSYDQNPANVDQPKEYLSIKDITQMIPVSAKTIRRMIKLNKIKAKKFGRDYIIRKKDLDNYFKQ